MPELDILAGLRAAVAAGRTPGPALRHGLVTLDDPATLGAAGRILANLPEDGALRPVRVDVVATFTLGAFPYLLKAALVGAGAGPVVRCADYGSFDLTMAGPAADADVLACLIDDGRLMPARWDAADVSALIEQVEARADGLRVALLATARRGRATVVTHTVPVPADVHDGLISGRARAAFAAAWHRVNASLLDLAAEEPRVAVVDLVTATAATDSPVRDDRLHKYADLPYTAAVLAVLAQQIRRVVQARMGLSRKVLALDLDNTLWGGVLGEDGPDGLQLGGLYPGRCYTDLQHAVRRLREQGVILALASKNNAEPVERTMAEHPEMVLRAADFSARAVDWAPKSANLRRMAETLGLSPGSFVFLDDSDFELGEVAAQLPEVAVLPAGGDPAHLTRTVLRDGWFDVPELTDTDRSRPELYRARAQRTEHAAAFATPREYLEALAIEVTGAPVTGYTVARAAQMAARTNQFNLTGELFDPAATAAMAAGPEHLVATFGVRDRFGDEGIVGAAWLRTAGPRWELANLVLSCRVLGRGVEFAIAGWLAQRAAAAGADRLAARFVATGRNGAADGYLDKAGFGPAGPDGWREIELDNRPDTVPAWIRLRDTRLRDTEG
jgi:FkbH-like protein